MSATKQEVLQALLDGHPVQYVYVGSTTGWVPLSEEGTFRRLLSGEVGMYPERFRIVKPDRVWYYCLRRDGRWAVYPNKRDNDPTAVTMQFKITFDGETDNIKSVEAVQ